MSAPLPCPFCGCKDIAVVEGSTFRWRLAQCNGCGAQGPDVRIQTSGSGTKEEWEQSALDGALTEWNRRHAESDLAAARANLEIAECALLAHGYRKSCDIPACNCGDQWHHGGNAVARLVEIRDAISERESFKNNGKTILQCVKECVRSDIDLTEALARVEKLEGAEEDRDEYQRQAKLYAERCAESDIELEAARAMLRDCRLAAMAIREHDCKPGSYADTLLDRIDAALAGQRREGE